MAEATENNRNLKEDFAALIESRLQFLRQIIYVIAIFLYSLYTAKAYLTTGVVYPIPEEPVTYTTVETFCTVAIFLP